MRAASGAPLTLFVLSLGAALAFGLSGCSTPGGSGPRPVDSDIAALLTPTATPTPQHTAQAKPTLVTWVKGQKLVQTVRFIPAKTRQDRLEAALFELVVNGPRASEQRRGLETTIPPGLVIDGTVHRRRVTLDVPNNSQFESGGVELAVGQLATTALSIPNVRTVVFSVDGSPTDVSVPDAKKPQRVLTMRDYRTVLR
jgi:hypothetical protein